MAEVLAEWNDFTGGHWGNLGPSKAEKNQWGGVNMVTTPHGIMPCCASRALTLDTQSNGEVLGQFWNWGGDGKLYYLQQTDSTTFTVKRFTPNPDVLPNTNETVGSLTGDATYQPDWATVADIVYLTVWGDRTYTITAGVLATLTGSYGNAPAGRAICIYGERLMVGGVSDVRFGTVANRIVFSGDDTSDDPTDRTAWESLNFFDVGPPDAQIVGMYPIRDQLVVILADQTVYIVTGVPGTNATSRRVYGFHKGSGSVESFRVSHAATDPSQIRLWLYDHSYRGPARFTGLSMSRLPNFGIPQGDRTATAAVEGELAMIGGPDEFIAHGVVLGRSAGEGVVNQDLVLVRRAGTQAIITRDVIGPWS